MKWVKEISETDESSQSGRTWLDKLLGRRPKSSERARQLRADSIKKCFIHPDKISKDFCNMDKSENLWLEPTTFDFLLDKKEYKRFQRDYENFCGGFLYYHDEQVKKGKVDHYMYFEWGPLKNEKGSVAIYLWPKPEVIKKQKTNGAEFAAGAPMTAQHAALPPLPDTEESVDPPKPPPPPPPPLVEP